MKLSITNAIIVCITLFSCTYSRNDPKDTLPDPIIQSGVAKVSGRITNHWRNVDNKNLTVSLHYPNPVTADISQFETGVDEKGYFHFEVPVESNFNIGILRIFADTRYYKNTAVGVVSGEETTINITYDEEGDITVKMESSLPLASGDITNFGKTMTETREYRPSDWPCNYTEDPDEFAEYSILFLKKKLEYLDRDSMLLSKNGKNYISNEIKLLYLNHALFDWEFSMVGNYVRCKNAEDSDFHPSTPSISYFSFLKYFNLNNPQYLYNFEYPNILQLILSDTILGVSSIGNTMAEDWLEKVKTTMAGLIGSDSGLFYDMLTAHAYVKQLNDELTPLSDIQKENIKNYFQDRNEEIVKILLRKNEEIVQLAEGKTALAVNKTPNVPREKLMDSIISKYQGKVVIIDFWATWCGPCLDAMKQYRGVKGGLKDKNIVFVYITNGSSPQKRWEEQIKGIGGEHYYVNSDEWEYWMETFNFIGIPSYVIFDTKGALRHQFTGYPGNDKMLTMIENLLP